jgi:23S rRNA U2552 (ribose-2'-O)-methylase RlmE/FtsJ
MATTSPKNKTQTSVQYPEIGNFVHYHIMQNKIKKADLARTLAIAPKVLTGYFKRDSLQLAVLWKLSLAMEHNFLAHLGEYLPYRYETQREKALLEQLIEQNEQIKEMKIQIEVYKEITKRG